MGTYGANTYVSHGFDNSLSLDDFRNNLTATITSNKRTELTFELCGLDAPIANALRRILLAEVPTIAIERVFVHANSSLIPVGLRLCAFLLPNVCISCSANMLTSDFRVSDSTIFRTRCLPIDSVLSRFWSTLVHS
jgi:RNA polymerase Rpb3/Rpb11 dimerisation domain